MISEKFHIRSPLNKDLPKVYQMVAYGTVHWFMRLYFIIIIFFFFHFSIRKFLMEENLYFQIILQSKRFSNTHITSSWHSGCALSPVRPSLPHSDPTSSPSFPNTSTHVKCHTSLWWGFLSPWPFKLFVLVLPVKAGKSMIIKNHCLMNCFVRN